MSETTVATPHPDYRKAEPRWRRGRELYAGSDAVKAGSGYSATVVTLSTPSSSSVSISAYLPQPPGMSLANYAFYKERALFYNALRRTVQALGGAVLRRSPRVEPGQLPEDQVADLTMRDEPVEAVARWAVNETLTVGRCGLLLDMPEDGGRPYWAMREAESIVNWRTGRVGDDPDQVTMVVLREDVERGTEFEHECVTQYRQLALLDGVYQTRVWAATGDGDEYVAGAWTVPTRRGVPLDFVPFTFIGPTGTNAEVEDPPLDDLTHVQIAHFRNSADHEHGLYYTSCPTPWAKGVSADGPPLKIGPSVVWLLGPDGAAGMLEFSGQGMGAIREAMAAKERLMATLGARLLEQQADASETATAVRVRHSGDAAALSTIAASVSQGMTQMLRWHAWWFAGIGDVPTDVRVDLGSEFFAVKATPDEVRSALLMVQADKISFETFYRVLEGGGWARDGVTAEQELVDIGRGANEPGPDDDPGPAA